MSYKPLIYDEETIGRTIYEKGYVEEFKWSEMLPLAKYFRYELGYGDARVKTALKDFLSKTIGFNYYRMRGVIGKIIRRSKNEYIKTGSVYITETELNEIRRIKNFKWQKITLVLVFLSKRQSNNGYVKLKEWSEIKLLLRSSRVVANDIWDVLSYLYANKKVKVSENKDYDAVHEILLIDKILNNIVFIINNDKDARNLPSLYKTWCGGELSWCKNCDNEFVKTNNKNLFCNECSSDKEKERKIKYIRKIRNTMRVDA